MMSSLSPRCRTQTYLFMIEGVTPGTENLITATLLAESSNAEEYVNPGTAVTVVAADLDVDGDNDDGFALPKQNVAEEYNEDVPHALASPAEAAVAGKTVALNNGDADGDGVVDHADGFDLDGIASNADDASPGASFTPLVLELPAPLDLATAAFRLSYSGSGPAAMTGTTPGAGHLRVWTKNGSEARDGRSVTAGGDYVTPNTFLTPAQLGLSSSNRTVTLWMEAIAATSFGMEAENILLQLAPGGATAFDPPTYDRVRVALGAEDPAVLPSTPTGLVAAGIAPGRIALRWDPPASGETYGYRIYRSTSPNVTPSGSTLVASVSGGVSQYLDSGLSVGVRYYYVIVAGDAAGRQSAPSNEASALSKNEDADIDNDGIPNVDDADSDNDGTDDDTDADDDNDGVLDSDDDDDTDSDNDGIVDWDDNDNDNDGIPDGTDADNDNDGTVDTSDPDDDNDGTPDRDEPTDPDDDNDGTSDGDDSDDDNDGMPDTTDPDDDNDGVPDGNDPDDGDNGEGNGDESTRVLINFDELTTGTVITNQYQLKGAIFSAGQGAELKAHREVAPSVPNLAVTYGPALNGDTVGPHDVYLDFVNPINGLRFYAAGDNAAGEQASVNVFRVDQPVITLPVITTGTYSTGGELIDLAAYKQVTRVEIVNVVDPGGLGWDDFSFIPAFGIDLQIDEVPEADEDKAGGYVVVNDDRDEANTSQGGAPRADNEPHWNGVLDKHRIVANDNELRDGKLIVKAIGPDDFWRLSFSNKIKVWFDRGNGWEEIISDSEGYGIQGEFNLKIEGIAESAAAKDAAITAKLFARPIGPDALPKATDKVNLSVLKAAVHPLAGDFISRPGHIVVNSRAGLEGEPRYYTTAKTTLEDKAAQTQDKTVRATVHIPMFHAALLKGKQVFFRLIDPDDATPYDTNGDGGDDNLPGVPAATITTIGDGRLQEKVINGTSVLAAEAELNVWHISGNNYQVEASLDPNFGTTLGRSMILIAWRRVYLEVDRMYRKGATIVLPFQTDGDANDDVLQVDNTSDFVARSGQQAGTSVHLFSRDGVSITREVLAKTVDTITVADLPAALAKYSGVVPLSDLSLYPAPLEKLTEAFGEDIAGTDGGAFVEFRANIFGSGVLPKYANVATQDEGFRFAQHWFTNMNTQDVLQIAAMADHSDARPFAGVTVPQAVSLVGTIGRRTALTFFDRNANAYIVAHEIGHHFGSLGIDGWGGYVDRSVAKPNHTGSGDDDIMSYNSVNDVQVEFSLDSINEIRKVQLV